MGAAAAIGVALTSSPTLAATINVPGDYSTIQEAVGNPIADELGPNIPMPTP